MSSQLIVAGLDLGSHCVKCVIGLLHSDGQLDVIGTGSHPALGFKSGVVCDQERAVQSIRAAVDEADLRAQPRRRRHPRRRPALPQGPGLAA